MTTGRGAARASRGIGFALAACLVSLFAATSASATAAAPAQITGVRVYSMDGGLIIRTDPPADHGGPIAEYVATCAGNGMRSTANDPNGTVTVRHLTNGLFYLCSVHAVNAAGAGPDSYARPGMPGLSYTTSTMTYCTRAGTPLLLDLFRPKTTPPTTTPMPVVLYVHGGGWNAGNRSLKAATIVTMLTSHGFALASVDYRLAPAANPAQQVTDVACAVRYLRAHAASLRLLPAKIGGIGTSAGGNLISLLGVNPPAPSASDQWAGQSNKIQAVVDDFGISEFSADEMRIMPQVRTYFGTTDQGVIDSYGPINYVSPGDAPFFIVHGVLDPIVPVHESSDFYNRLRAAHVPATFIPVAHMGHEFQPVDGNLNPTLVAVDNSELSFLAAHLK